MPPATYAVALDQYNFQRFLDSQQPPKEDELTIFETKTHYTTEDAADLLAALLKPPENKPGHPAADLAVHEAFCRRIQNINLDAFATLLNDTRSLRKEYVAEHGKQPSGGRIYREFRFRLELNDTDPYLNEVVPFMGALLNDDLRHGSLPF
jgi:hypothetical protein